MKTALFVDFDNVYSGLRRISPRGAERFARQPQGWLRWLTEELPPPIHIETGDPVRRVLVRRCYLNPILFQQYRRPFHEAGFEIVDCPPMTATGKTSTDIHLVLDTMDALLDATHFDEFIVFSADADFSPVLRRLRRHDRRTVVFAAGAMSESYKASADVVLDIPVFLRDALALAEPAETSASTPDVARALPSNSDLALRRQAPAIARAVVPEAGAPAIAPVAGTELAAAAAAPIESMPAQPLSAQALDEAAAQSVRRLVAAANRPVHLSAVAHALRQAFPQLASGWNGAPTLVALLRRLHLEPLQSSALEDGTTFALYDPQRHTLPAKVIADAMVATMLRAAELPAMKAPDLAQVLHHSRTHMGSSEPFEIATVSAKVNQALALTNNPVSARRIAAVLQGLIFGGLDAGQAFADDSELTAAAMA